MKLATWISALLLAAACFAATPQVVPYQGTLLDASDQPINGNVPITFKLYDSSADGVELWSEVHAAVPVSDGLFNVILGGITPWTDALLDAAELWMETTVNGEALAPRVRVTSVPYALRAGKVEGFSAANIADMLALFQSLPDADGDGHIKFSMGGTDCDDLNPLIHPGATEVCDGVDNNCNGGTDEGFGVDWYADVDGDGYGDIVLHVVSCTQPVGYVANPDDCDDINPETHPGAIDTCNGIDNDCDGAIDEDSSLDLWYQDADFDGWGDPNITIFGCQPGLNWVLQGGDCNDSDSAIHPAASEVCNTIDDNCNGIPDDNAVDCVTFYRDLDEDGWGDPGDFACLCAPSSQYTATQPGDCNDFNPSIHPGAPELCNGLIDDNCDGVPESDGDLSGCPSGFVCFNGTCISMVNSQPEDNRGE